MLSIVTPAYNEAANLPALYDRLAAALSELAVEWEWIVVDDHSRDATFEVVERLAERDPRIRGLRLARNSGSHTALTCGLHHATGDAAVVMAADLQDPPETLGTMLERWRAGAQVVWAVRRRQPGERRHARFAAAYYWIMRRLVGLSDMPSRGADFFLADRVVLEAFRRFPERNGSVLALITWLGFRQDYVEYDKQPRAAGTSGWTLGRKITLVVDSVTSFSAFPIRACSLLGLALMAGSVVLLVAGIAILPVPSAVVLLVLAVVFGLAGLQLLAVGVVGEYVFRALDEARRRPQYVIEAVANGGSRPGSVV